MAKVTGPLMSLEASGTIGNALTFSRWVGRPYVRRYTVPGNPQTLGQETHRNRFSAIGSITTWPAATSKPSARTLSMTKHSSRPKRLPTSAGMATCCA